MTLESVPAPREAVLLLDAPIGPVVVTGTQGGVTGIYTAAHRRAAGARATPGPTLPTLREVARQLEAYFARKSTTFDLALAPQGTPFQRDVWRALTRIPFGETTTYAALAIGLGRPSAVRAVAAANAKNPISIVVPCHRVIGKDGTLRGYAGGLACKEWLLAFERGACE
jgi:methylated-DNA-[protein]-cysteine S-methyltransferase